MDHSIQLLSVHPHTKNFSLTPSAREFLTGIQKPLAIVSIAGLYRTGKSYLVNRLIKHNVGFKTGQTTEAVSKGLSIWGEPLSILNEKGEQMCYLVIDSEGIGSMDQDNKFDVKLMMLVFLISSTVIYNSLGVIDQQALDQLRAIIKLSKCIENAEDSKARFIWVLRDFALELADKKGREITPNQYLQQCLEEVPSVNPQIKKKNEIRKAIKENLGKRSCYALVRPSINESQLADLSHCHLRQDFVNQIELLRQDVFCGLSSDLKMINGHRLNGKLFCKVLQSYISSINRQQCPMVSDIWQSIIGASVEQLLEEIGQKVKREIKGIVLPLENQELKVRLNSIENKYYKLMEESIAGRIQSPMEYHRSFVRKIQKLNKDVKQTNLKLRRQMIMKEVRGYVGEHLRLQDFGVEQLTSVKDTVARLELSRKNESEAYEHVLQVIYDIFHIAQQNLCQLQKENTEFRRMLEEVNSDHKSNEAASIRVKSDYHQALRTIATLKQSHSELQKTHALLKQQCDNYSRQMRELKKQNQQESYQQSKKIEQNSSKWKIKIEQSQQVIKRLREENQELHEHNETLIQQNMCSEMLDRKQIIFQEKINDTWGKFDQERVYYNKEIEKCKNEAMSCKKQCESLEKQLQVQIQERKKQQRENENKQQLFQRQMGDLKTLHQEAKKTYCSTFDTIRDNQRINKNLDQMKNGYEILQESNKPRQQTNYQKIHQTQTQSQNEHQHGHLEHEIQRLTKQLKSERMTQKNNKQEISFYRDRCSELEKQLEDANERFTECVTEIEAAKEKERSLYEESIVRLLSNIEKSGGRQGTYSSCRFS